MRRKKIEAMLDVFARKFHKEFGEKKE